MPFVSNMPDEEQKTDPTLAPQGPVAPVGGGTGAVRLSPSASVPSAGGGGTSGAPGSSPTPAAGGQFASLNQYLTANQGQAAPLAGKLTPGINQEYQNLDTANNAAISSINNQVTNAPGYTPSNPGVLSAEAANPASFTSSPNNVASFQSLLNNTYGGPVSAESTSDYANQQNAINTAISQGQSQTGTEAGREQLLSQNEAAPTTGVTALNSAILSQDPNALASIENAYAPFQNLVTNLNAGAQGVNQTISKEQADAAASAQAANQQIAGQIGALNTGVAGELTAAQNAAAAQNAQVKADLAAGTPTPADLQALGMTTAQWNSLSAADKAAATAQVVKSNQGQFGATSGTTTLDPTQFLAQQDPNAVLNAANVATPADYAKAQAFQTLLQGMNLAEPTAVINPATASQAGTAPTNLNQYDYQTAMNTATSAKADEVAAAQAYVDALQSGADEQHAQQVAQQAGRQSMEQKAEALANMTVTAPIALASQLPVIGKPIANAVDTVVQAVSKATWICTAMQKADVLSAEEVKTLHDHLYKAIYDRPLKFLGYIMLGKPLVMFANVVKIDWKAWKYPFYYLPMSMNKPTMAVEYYERAFWNLTRLVWYKLTYQENPTLD
jgi:hypothetical protein